MSEGYVTLLLDMWLLIISHPSVKFDSHRSRENDVLSCFIFYVTWCDFVDNKPALERTTLSSLLAIGLAEVEI